MQGPRLKLWAGFLSCLFFCLCEVASSKTLKCEQGSSFEEDVRRASVEDTTAINCKTKRFGGFIPTQIGLLSKFFGLGENIHIPLQLFNCSTSGCQGLTYSCCSCVQRT